MSITIDGARLTATPSDALQGDGAGVVAFGDDDRVVGDVDRPTIGLCLAAAGSEGGIPIQHWTEITATATDALGEDAWAVITIRAEEGAVGVDGDRAAAQVG